MKAVLALVIIYVGTFFLVIQGASQNAVQASPQGSEPGNAVSRQANPSIDPAKEADIRSLMELVGARSNNPARNSSPPCRITTRARPL